MVFEDLSPYLIRIRHLERLLQDSFNVIASKNAECSLLLEIEAALDEAPI